MGLVLYLAVFKGGGAFENCNKKCFSGKAKLRDNNSVSGGY